MNNYYDGGYSGDFSTTNMNAIFGPDTFNNTVDNSWFDNSSSDSWGGGYNPFGGDSGFGGWGSGWDDSGGDDGYW